MPFGLAHGVQLAADQAEQRRLDLGTFELRAAGHEPHDRRGHLHADECAAGPVTAVSACGPVMRARRMRFCVTEGIFAFSPSRWAR
jgi:hypothetical protein